MASRGAPTGQEISSFTDSRRENAVLESSLSKSGT